ncbi:hypothetical protein A5844_000531, partial [Enterococcus sp. 10A9_DIV0425]
MCIRDRHRIACFCITFINFWHLK